VSDRVPGVERIEVAGVTSAAYNSASWPIAGAMLQYSDRTLEGKRTLDANLNELRVELLPFRYEGFSAIELANRWLDLNQLDDSRVSDLREMCTELRLDVPGYVVTGRPLSDDSARTENLAYTHTAIDRAALVGAKILCLGLHPFAPRRPNAPLWFWTDQSSDYDDDAERQAFLIGSFRELAAHAEGVGIQITIEMYPGTAVGTAERAVRLIREIDHPAAGLNPDLGNLVRVQGAIEEWQDVAVDVLPFANYWHVKNYARAENPFTSSVFTTPASLEDGIVDYRKAVRYALSAGFAGTFVTEHYGGDGIAVSARNRDYLRRVLASILDEDRLAAS
jgi:sugar phosphate isomerase/epimerase